jgi:uncharacterized membrane protein
MFGVIIAVVVVVLFIAGMVVRYYVKKRRAETRRLNAKPLADPIFLPSIALLGSTNVARAHEASEEVVAGIRLPPPTYHIEPPPAYTDVSGKQNTSIV